MSPLRLLVLFVFAGIVSSFAPTDGCKIMHNGRFRYMADKEEIIVTIKDSAFTETYQGGKYYVHANIEWLNDCEYVIVITKVTHPAFPYGPGDEVDVRINRVEGNEIYYTATVKRVSWDGKFTRLEDN